MNPLLDHLAHASELTAFFLLVWRVVRALNRFESVMRDFPPHQHVNGKVIYPHDYEPGRVDTLKVSVVGQ
jgi:hypothetical protein